MDTQWEVLRHLEETDVRDVGVLVERVTEADGVHPLSEHVMLHLRYGGDVDVRHVLARVEGELVGYAHLDVTDKVAGSSAELAVTPTARRQGVAYDIVRHLLAETPDGRLRLWSHGEPGGAAPLAASLGFTRSRVLWQMRRSLAGPLPEAVLPDGVRLRSFLPGLDDDEWLALNAAAFVDLADQGGWTLEDLHVRMREPWFDPAGFLVATEEGADGEHMVGFHWTKVHGADHAHVAEPRNGDDTTHDHDPAQDHQHGHGHEPIGEVYVVGIAPGQQGRGLGRALTLAGLSHLRTRGLPDAMLYVDASNTAAIALYGSLGFSRWDVDVEFTSPPRQP